MIINSVCYPIWIFVPTLKDDLVKAVSCKIAGCKPLPIGPSGNHSAVDDLWHDDDAKLGVCSFLVWDTLELKDKVMTFW